MELQTLADVKLAGRALTAGWLDGCEEKRKRVVDAMFKVIENAVDEELKVKAFEALLRADQADLKRMEVAIKQQEADDAKRLRLLEVLRHLPPGAIGKLASGDAGSIEE